MKTYFSIKPWKFSGFTDQLLQFSAFIKLGRSLGWEYNHLDFENRRSSKRIYEFLGINDYLAYKYSTHIAQDREGNRAPLALTLCDQKISSDEVRTLEDLKEFVKRRAEKIAERSNVRTDRYFVFRLKPGSTRRFFTVIERSVQDLPDGLSLTEAFLMYGHPEWVKNDLRSIIDKVIVHIRLGDTGVYKTPWGKYIFWEFLQASSRRTLRHDDCFDPEITVDPECFYRVVKEVARNLDLSSQRIHIFSDGYRRILGDAIRNKDSIGISEEQAKILEEAKPNVNIAPFRALSEIKGTKLTIGEGDGNLFGFIFLALCSRIVIISSIQRMLPKLFILYSCSEDPRLIIVITNRNIREKYGSLGLDQFKNTEVICIPKNDPAIESKIRKAIEKQQGNWSK